MPETQGAIIGEYALRQMYPTFQLVDDPAMTVESLCHEVRQNRCRSEGRQLLTRFAQLLETDAKQAIGYLATQTGYLQRLVGGKQLDRFADEAADTIMHNYEMVAAGYNLSVCPHPWHPLQEESGGIQPDDYIVIYGRPKSMKSWVLAYYVAWTFEQGKRILIYTKEMTADNVYMRVFGILAGVRYSEFRKGKLTEMERQALYQVKQYVKMMRSVQSMVCLSGKDAGERGDTVSWLRSKIEEHKPDICFIDGMYLMSDARGGPRQKDHARVQNISRDLRQTILETRVPVICTLQANRAAATNKEANLDEIAFSDAIGQDATLAMRVINEKHVPTLALMIGGSREFNLEGFRIHGIPATNFGYAGPISMDELLSAAQADAGDPKNVKKASTARNKHQNTDPVDPTGALRGPNPGAAAIAAQFVPPRAP
jgi:hypothetical protein